MEHDPFEHDNGEPVSFALVDAQTMIWEHASDLHSAVVPQGMEGVDVFTGHRIMFAMPYEAIKLIATQRAPAMLLVPDYAIRKVSSAEIHEK